MKLLNAQRLMTKLLLLLIFMSVNDFANAQNHMDNREVRKVNGYRGIWFALGQRSEYGDKYSGGLGTYTAKHAPLAIYAPKAHKTFFVYGGTTQEDQKHLLCMIGSFDHKTRLLTKPVVVYDKKGVDDPHDNPSIALDDSGFVWVFVSGRGKVRPGFKFRSKEPYSTNGFDQITEEELTYPQPRYISGKGFLHLFTKYTGIRELYYETSPDGRIWSEDQKLAGIKRSEDKNSGHYQVSGQYGEKVVTFFNWHPNGDVDKRTNVYYLQTVDFGKTWTDVSGHEISLPVTDVNSSILLREYYSKGKNVYVKDVAFDGKGNPVLLFLVSGGHEPGPKNGARGWSILHWTGENWETNSVTDTDHNYDMGSLFTDGKRWQVILPSENSPQKWGAGGEVVIWGSTDEGKSWQKEKQITRNSPRNHNYIRKVVNGDDDFRYFWADGNPDKMSISKLYFGDSKGRVWAMPYDMSEENGKPVRVK